MLILGPAAIGWAIGLLRGGDREAALVAALVVGLVAAVGYQALRRQIERRVIRLIFGDRDDPYEVVAQLSSQLQAQAAVDPVLSRVAETVAHTLRLPYAAVELEGPDGTTDVHSSGTPGTELTAIPLTHQGEQVGRLLLATGSHTEPFGPADRRLIMLLVQQVGAAAHGVILAERLQRALERAVNVREEERRRLRRDIHDGLGPMLASVRMRLAVAQRLVADDPQRAAALLSELSEHQKAIQADVRRLLDGLRPPVLDQLGLVAAIREQAAVFTAAPGHESPLAVSIEVGEELPPLTAAGEVAAYHITLEALTNVARHAHASSCRVSLGNGPGLVIEVVDDGIGLPDSYRAGVGLNSMRERAMEVGGSCVIEPAPGGGTAVRAMVPAETHRSQAAARDGGENDDVPAE
jgi:signal transduction histidine kinase